MTIPVFYFLISYFPFANSYVLIFAAVTTFALTTWLYVTRISHFRLAVRRIVGEGSEVEHLDETATSLITVVNRDYRKASRSEIACDDGISRTFG